MFKPGAADPGRSGALGLTIPQPVLLLADEVIEQSVFTAPRNVRFRG